MMDSKMPNNLLIQEELEEHLACSLCGFLISFGPVTRFSKGYQCGRCPNENGEQCIIYETLAKNYLFPCKNKSSGCTAVLPFGNEMENHEMSCAKTLYKCPVALRQKCDWEGKFDVIEEHFEAMHSAIVLKDLKLNVNLEEVAEVTYAYFYDDTVFFLIDLCFDKDKGLVVDLMRVLKHEKVEVLMNETKKYVIALYYTYGKISFSRNVSKYFLNNNCAKIANNNAIDIVHLNYITTIEKQSFIKVELELPKSCLVSGSGEVTKETITVCKNRMYYCKYMDCFEKVQQHENTCYVYNCPLGKKKCDWRGVKTSIIPHCEKQHNIGKIQSPIIKLDEILSSEEITSFYIVCRDIKRHNHNFSRVHYIYYRVCIKLENIQTADSSMYIAVQCIRERDEELDCTAYFAEADDGSVSEFILPLSNLTSEEEAFKNSTHIYLKDLKGSTLSFKIA